MGRLTKSQEDYLRVILTLSRQGPGVRITDIAAHFGISKASACVAVQSLEKKGYVRRDAQRLVYLSSQGEEQARRMLDHYSLVSDFLTGTLQVAPNVASHDACELEHALSDESFSALRSLLGRGT